MLPCLQLLTCLLFDTSDSALSSYWYHKVRTKSIKSVTGWTPKKVNGNVFRRDILLFPLSLPCHWVLGVIDFRQNKILVYDSVQNAYQHNFKTYAVDFLKMEAERNGVEFDVSTWVFHQAVHNPVQVRRME